MKIIIFIQKGYGMRIWFNWIILTLSVVFLAGCGSGEQSTISQMTENTSPTFSKISTINPKIIDASAWKELAVGGVHTVGLSDNNTLWTWGYNHYGQLGDGSRLNRLVPTEEKSSTWQTISAGYFHTVAIKNDGTLWSWGRNNVGQLGDGTTNDVSSPIQETTKGTNWIKVDAGRYYTVAIKSDGTLWSWGHNSVGQLGDGTQNNRLSPTQENSKSTNWISVYSNSDHTVALKSDGTLWGWGYNGYGQLGDATQVNRLVPTQESTLGTNWSKVKIGSFHTVALKNDGTLWSWGWNKYGQLGDGTTIDRLTPTQEVTQSTDWISVNAAYLHSMAIKSDGTLWLWGDNGHGQLGDGTTDKRLVPTQESTNSTNWQSVSAGLYHTLGIKTNGTLWAWGYNDYGQLGNGTTTEIFTPADTDNAINIVPTLTNLSLQVEENVTIGTVVGRVAIASVGDSDISEFTLNDVNIFTIDINGILRTNSLLNFDTVQNYLLSVTATNDAGVSLPAEISIEIQNVDNIIPTLGSTSFILPENISIGTVIEQVNVIDVGDSAIFDFSVSDSTTFSISSTGTLSTNIPLDFETVSSYVLHVTARNQAGLSLPAEINITLEDVPDIVPTLVSFATVVGEDIEQGTVIGTINVLNVGDSNITEFSLNDESIFTADSHGNIHLHGNLNFAFDPFYALTVTATNAAGASDAVDVNITIHEVITSVFIAKDYSMTLDVNETVVLDDWRLASEVTSDNMLTATLQTQGIYGEFSLDGENLLYIKTEETNETDRVILEISDGINSTEINVTVESLYWKEIAGSGQYFTSAIKSDGTLWGWGVGNAGRLGNGSLSEQLLPVQESTESNEWKTLSAGGAVGAAIKEDGSLWLWGSNSYGQLGDGTTTGQLNPTQESTGSTWSSVSLGAGQYTVAIKTDGTLWAWGYNLNGQLGDGTIVNKLVPTQESTGTTNWKFVSANYYHTIAIKTDGTLWSWGRNTQGELGDGTTDQQIFPTQEITAATNWKFADAGIQVSVAIKEDGTLWTWGYNGYGQLSRTSIGYQSSTPEVIMSKTSWIYVNAGGNSVSAIKEDGTLWIWGSNDGGQLGDGTFGVGSRSAAEQIATLPSSLSWYSVELALSHGIALSTEGRLWVWGTNYSGVFGNGTLTNSYMPIPQWDRFYVPAPINMILDINETMVTKNWKEEAIANGLEESTLTALFKTYGKYGALYINGDFIEYVKYTETNATDSAILEITDGIKIVEVNVTVESLHWKEVVSGEKHSAAIKSDGTLWLWGLNDYGQLGDNTHTNKSIPTQENTKSVNWKQVNLGITHTVAVQNDGTLWSWGLGNYGELGDNNQIELHPDFEDCGYESIVSLVPSQEHTKATDWDMASAGNHSTVAIKTDGTLWGWGANFGGELGIGVSDTYIRVPTQESTLSTNWKYVDLHSEHTVALKATGTLWAWGKNYSGQLGDGTTDNQINPVQESTYAIDWTDVQSGYNFTVGLKSDGTLWTWGDNAHGQLGNGSIDSHLIPIQEVTLSTNWKSISLGGKSMLAMKTNDTLWVWGDNTYGQLGDNTTTEKSVPTQEYLAADSWAMASISNSHTLALDMNGKLWAWGDNIDGALGTGVFNDKYVPTQEASHSDIWTSIDSSSVHTVALKSDGTLWSWGANDYGQLGDGTTVDKDIPVQEQTYANDWVAVSAASNHTVALKSDGTLWSWGSNEYGQLGNNSNATISLIPVQESTSSTEWSSVNAGALITIAIRSDGTLWSWGYNSYSMLGNGTTTHASVPTQEALKAINWKYASIGMHHVSAVQTNGTLWSWGSNEYGQLGDGTTIDKSIPTQSTGSTQWASVSAGDVYTLALKQNGTLWGWGHNLRGQLGTNETYTGPIYSNYIPTQEATSSTNWTKVVAGNGHSVAIKDDLTLWTWGINSSGQLGNGYVEDVEKSTNLPIQEGNKTADWVDVAVGSAYSVGIKNDGSLWSWGSNDRGQLGDDSITISPREVQPRDIYGE